MRAGRPVSIRLGYSSATAWPPHPELGIGGGNVQLGWRRPGRGPAAARRLRGFAKLQLDPGATTEVRLRLDRDDLAAFDEATGTWVVHQGTYEVLVGRSSRDLRGTARFEVRATRPG